MLILQHTRSTFCSSVQRVSRRRRLLARSSRAILSSIIRSRIFFTYSSLASGCTNNVLVYYMSRGRKLKHER
ncbi:unnamed protein product [Protopolystoma xenopodis]|uniref:Uncharacterized protein n=1 Tax=Protopolystoma xenopodis TaxID=117903 RepID=A0A448XNK1_9PLAT|nr:unnamed protein product [Protopolystoma xenopodis]